MTNHTVVGDRVALEVGFRAARARLRSLVELAGPDAGLTRLADVCLADLTESDDCAHIALQWDAIAADGKLFTALLADLMLVPGGDKTSSLSLAGAYWPPPGRADGMLGRAIERCCAMAIASSLLDLTACGLAHPAGTAGDGVPVAGLDVS